jgi:hypothetical protein
LEGSFDHKHRVTLVWADIGVKLMTEPPQSERYTVSIDISNRRIEGHNQYGRLVLEPTNGLHMLPPPACILPSLSSSVNGASTTQALDNGGYSHMIGDMMMNEVMSIGDVSSIATTMVPTMMSQSVGGGTTGGYAAHTPNNDGQTEGYGIGNMSGGGMMYGPQMTPQGMTYTLMPTHMAIQAHAVAAQMLYGNNNSQMYDGVPYAPMSTSNQGFSLSGSELPSCSSNSSNTSGHDNTGVDISSGDRSRSGSTISTASGTSSGIGDVHDDQPQEQRGSFAYVSTPRNRSASTCSNSSSTSLVILFDEPLCVTMALLLSIIQLIAMI